MSKRDGLKKKQKSTKIWEIIEDILIYKTGKMLEDPTYEKDFNPFLIIRYLSMNPSLLPYCNYLNRLHDIRGQKSLTKKQFYILMLNLLPIVNERIQYIKSSIYDNPDVDFIMEYYECNRREALMYLNLYGQKWASDIKKEFGGTDKK